MHGRLARVNPPALLLALLGLLAGAGNVRAHRLEVEYRVRPHQEVQVESWFGLTSKPPRSAKVQVWRANGELLTEGVMDDQGIFVFSYAKPEELRVVVLAGAGHRAEVQILASDLAQSPGTGSQDSDAADGQADHAGSRTSLVDRRPRESVKDVLVGIGFLLAVAAFVLSLRNARQLRELNRKMDQGTPGETRRGSANRG
ncbi:MAG TPA: hypothetical protein VG013_40875 [Gemmataceae bacterium]|jgi:nickel transport protein|nr:hypothetical protein [Gemmataceae bacterium]